MTSFSAAKKIYVYILRRPCNEPFYVGVGRGARIAMHEKFAKRGEQSHKSHLIRKIWRDGGQVIREIESWHQDDVSAKAREVELIAQIGRLDFGTGPLVNRTAGGDGVVAASDETKRLISERTKAAMSRDSVRESCRRHMMQKNKDRAWRESTTKAIADYWKEPANREAQSERSRTFPERDPEAFRLGVEARKKAMQSPEVRARMSASAKERWRRHREARNLGIRS